MEIREAIRLIQEKITIWLKHIVALSPNLVVALIVLLLFIFLSRYLEKLASRLIGRTTDNSSLVALLSQVFRMAIILTGMFVALSILGLDKAVTSLLAGAGIIGLALGLAFQDLTTNFLSGTFITIRQPIRVGDVVETNGYFGKVKEINLRSTIIDNFAGQEIEIPSKDILQKPIVNFSKSNERRLQLNGWISYKEDLQKVQDLALQFMTALPFLQEGKNVEFHYQNFGDNGVTFLIWFWIDQGKVGPPMAMSEAVKGIKRIFDEHDISVPLAVRTVEWKNEAVLSLLEKTKGYKNDLNRSNSDT
ncbi:mechanosensitive ion channel family protein [Xanthocytophaga agilis]|uniref:Mechanosensitive ion channel family protein n=1 Tax=Xanthocytophaga agilis TaxID=3048010 RepID=A0AAE3QXL7_9BACT|nr:mechanosensitive ion channel family protein [Xanthocytophaga agilis]MDJ1499949.1 mechanosensitive ion channel family protein [Xanthocytophaga agilis]